MSDPLRVYDPLRDEFGADGYPVAWHRGDPAIKHYVREQAGHRCIRCGHPYHVGEPDPWGEKPRWSNCGEYCSHGGPVRVAATDYYGRRGSYGLFTASLEGLIDCYVGTIRANQRNVSIQAEWRVLTVHHLDEVKANCRWWNLVALCQRCHLNVQSRVRMNRIWPHEHSEWFKPYVAAYYAWMYLGEELTRKETEARMDELLGLEVRQLELG